MEALFNIKSNPQGTAVDWLIFGAFVLGAIVLGRLLLLLTGKVLKPLFGKLKTRFFYLSVDMLEEPLAVALIVLGTHLGLSFVKIPADVVATVSLAENVAIILLATWSVVRLVDMLITSYISPLIEKSETDLDDQLLPIIRTLLKVVIWIVGGILALDNAGYDVGALLAGLGIGGLAFALAAQDTIANLFGGITIFTDSPFRLNERIKVGGVDGFVREIGIRVSRIETLEGRIITMPNSMLSKNHIENVSSEPSLKVILSLHLALDTAPEKVGEAVALLQEVASTTPGLTGKPVALVSDIVPWAIQLQMVYFIAKEAVVPDTKTLVHLEVLRRFAGAGIVLVSPPPGRF